MMSVNPIPGIGQPGGGPNILQRPGMFPQNAGSNQFMTSMPTMPAFNARTGAPGMATNPGMRGAIKTSGIRSGQYGLPQFNFQFGSTPMYGNQQAPNPYQVPTQSSPYTPYSGTGSQNSPFQWPKIPGTHAVPPQYPGLAGSFVNWLGTQIGQGVPAYNLSVPLPTGGQTQPGQLTAGENPLLTQLQNLFQGGNSSVPGANTLSTIANQGISALPEWQSMIQAQQQNIQQQQANLREQFAGMGDLAGSPFGTAMSNFNSQTTADQNALLAQLQQQNILQGQIPAAQFMMGQGGNLAQYLQGLDQQAIQNQYGEFIRTSPQYNPLIQDILSMSQVYPPTLQTGSGMGGIGALLSGGGQGAGSVLSALGDAGLL